MFPTHRRLAKVTAAAKEIPPRIIRTITDVLWALLEIFACNDIQLADCISGIKSKKNLRLKPLFQPQM
jgi:hypothetical protein